MVAVLLLGHDELLQTRDVIQYVTACLDQGELRLAAFRLLRRITMWERQSLTRQASRADVHVDAAYDIGLKVRRPDAPRLRVHFVDKCAVTKHPMHPATLSMYISLYICVHIYFA